MSKTKHKYRRDDVEDDGADTGKRQDRHKQKRIDRALRTKNIDELVDLDDEGNSYDEWVVQNWWNEDDDAYGEQ